MLESDIPKLKTIHAQSCFSYDFPDLTGPRIEAIRVFEDDCGEPIAAVIAERIPQLYLIGKPMKPAAMAAVVGIMTASMKEALSGRYNEANAFLPPQIDEKFGKWLQRRFGWVRSWKVWGVRF